MDSTTLATAYLPNEKMYSGIAQTNISFVAPLMGSAWSQALNPWGTGTVPTTAGRQCDSSLLGALPLSSLYEGTSLRIVRFRWFSPTGAGNVFFYDRLVDYAGFDATSTSAQSLGAQALPRTTTGYQVLPFIEVYSTAASSATTATISYTNSLGVAGRTGTASLPASWGTVGRIYPFQLQGGDLGVRSVQSVTLGTASAAAGSWGITIGRVVSCQNSGIPTTFSNASAQRDLTNAICLPFDTTACLTFFANTAAGWGSGTLFLTIL